MLSQTVLLALAGSAAAILAPGHFAARHQLQARQTGGAGSCAAAVASVEESMPTPPPALISWAGTQTAADPCGLTVPDSVKPVLTSYESEVSSWYVKNSAALNSALSQCPKFSSLAPNVVPSCTPGSGIGSGSPTTGSSNSQSTGSSGSSSSGSGSGSGSGSSNGNNGQPGKSAASRETALIGAAVALAGFLGVVAAL